MQFYFQYIGRVLIVVLLFFVVFIGFLAYLFTGNLVLGFFFFIQSFIITLPAIVLISGIRLVNTIRDDINKMLKISVNTTKYIFNDSQMLVKQRQSGLPISDVFKGVAIYVIRSSLKKSASEKNQIYGKSICFFS